MTILKKEFGVDKEGNRVYLFKLTNNMGHYIEVINLGAALRSIVVSDKEQNLVDVCLGYDTVSEYEENGGKFGAIVGRHANRLRGNELKIGNKTYPVYTTNGIYHMHGGQKGFDKYVWDVETQTDKIIFIRESKHLEEGYPGNLKIKVSYTFDDKDTLGISYEAISDMDTIVNLTNHVYFNLNGENHGNILEHTAQLNASTITENDQLSLPTGKILTIANTPFDFSKAKKIGEHINDENTQLRISNGYDHNYILDSKEDLKTVGWVEGDKTNIKMTVSTTCPAFQFYTANNMQSRSGKNGTTYNKQSGLCIETQYYPNSLEHPHFPSVILKKGEVWKEDTFYQFSLNK
jgi:aldose 1-epimerase